MAMPLLLVVDTHREKVLGSYVSGSDSKFRSKDSGMRLLLNIPGRKAGVDSQDQEKLKPLGSKSQALFCYRQTISIQGASEINSTLASVQALSSCEGSTQGDIHTCISF